MKEGKYNEKTNKSTAGELELRLMFTRDGALILVFKIVKRPSENCRTLNGGNPMALLLAGCSFKDGIVQHHDLSQLAAAAD